NSNITIWGGVGLNSVNLFDDNNTAPITYSVTDTTILINGRPGFSVLARETTNLALNSGSSSTATVNVFRSAIATAVNRAAIVNLGNSAHGVQDIRGALNLQNSGGRTTLNVDDTGN